MSGWISATTEAGVPADVAWAQVVHFEDYPRWLPSVSAVERTGEDSLLITARSDSGLHKVDVLIAEQLPGRRLVLTLSERRRARARLHLHALDEHSTRLQLEVDHDLDPLAARMVDLLFAPERQLEEGLRRFVDALTTPGSALDGH